MPTQIFLTPEVRSHPYSYVIDRVSVLAAGHLLWFILELDRSAARRGEAHIPVEEVRTKFHAAGHDYRPDWPFERLLDDLISAGLVECVS